MSDDAPVFDQLQAFHSLAMKQGVLEELAGDATTDSDSEAFLFIEEESCGFEFLERMGPRAIQAFKLLEVAQSQIAGEAGTGEMSDSEWHLLEQMLGAEFIDEADQAYQDCKEKTRNLEDMHDLDERAAWRLTEFVHLFEHVMLYGERMGRLRRDQARLAFTVLLRDFGEYFGLLCDDVSGSQQETLTSLAQYLSAFRNSSLYKHQLPIDKMTRLPLTDPRAKALLDFEIARGIEPHPVALKERVIRGDAHGNLIEGDSVDFVTHTLQVRYAEGISSQEVAVVNAILPIFAISVFEGFENLPQVEEYLGNRREELKQAEQQCFALLQCLKHYEGRVPSRMKEFDARDVEKAAQAEYRGKAKAAMEAKKSTSIGGMLKEKVSGVFAAVGKPVVFSFPEDRTMYRLHGYPETIGFFPQHVTIEVGDTKEEYTFLCHVDTVVDPHGDKPKMFEYQAVIGEGMLFDAHEAARDLFADAPAAMKRTLEAGPVVIYAKTVVHPGEQEASVDLEEVKLLGTYVALRGGMQSWMGQRYILSDSSADIFTKYEDVKAFVAKMTGALAV